MIGYGRKDKEYSINNKCKLNYYLLRTLLYTREKCMGEHSGRRTSMIRGSKEGESLAEERKGKSPVWEAGNN